MPSFLLDGRPRFVAILPPSRSGELPTAPHRAGSFSFRLNPAANPTRGSLMVPNDDVPSVSLGWLQSNVTD
jgi:hypothetical protein